GADPQRDDLGERQRWIRQKARAFPARFEGCKIRPGSRCSRRHENTRRNGPRTDRPTVRKAARISAEVRKFTTPRDRAHGARRLPIKRLRRRSVSLGALERRFADIMGEDTTA